MTALAELAEVAIPSGLGIDGDDMDHALLVGPPDQMRALALRIVRQVGLADHRPSLLAATVEVQQLGASAEEWKRRHDDLMAAVLDGRLVTAASLPHRPLPAWPAEDAPGQVLHAGADRAQEWTPRRWTKHLRGLHLGQKAALDAVRSWAVDRGEEPPGDLRALHGRPDAASFLLDWCDRQVIAREAEHQPW